MSQRSGESPEVAGFVELAEQYCDLISSRDAYPARDFVKRIHLLLAAVYAAGVRLPQVAPETSQAAAEGKGSERWSDLYKSLSSKLGARDHYLEMFAPYDFTETQSVTGSLADDLADIYADLMRGLTAWREGRLKDAVWEWQFHLEHHWGEHATGALRALHALGAQFDYEEPTFDERAV